MNTLRKPYPLINLEKKFILFTNAKCGGTTLKRWFLDSLDLENTFSSTFQLNKNYGLLFLFKWYKYRFFCHDLEKIKHSNSYLRKFIKIYRKCTIRDIKSHVNDHSFLRIAVVRDPFDRLVSGYVDKFCGDDLNLSYVKEVIEEISAKDLNGNHEITFAQFVDYLLRKDLIDVDPHWRPQTYILKGIDLDEVIELKDMSSKLPELSSKLGFESNINLTQRRQSNSYGKIKNLQDLKEVYNITNTELIKFKTENGFFPEKDAFYNEDIKQKVKTIYKDDFDAFIF